MPYTLYTKPGSDIAHEPTATTITLTAIGWVGSAQTVAVLGVTVASIVIVAPVPANQPAYVTAGIVCTSQGAGTLTFACGAAPATDLDVSVVIL